jgi:hypothetical protein
MPATMHCPNSKVFHKCLQKIHSVIITYGSQSYCFPFWLHHNIWLKFEARMRTSIYIHLSTLFLALLFSGSGINAQENKVADLRWSTLAKVEFAQRYDDNAQMEIEVPTFSTELIELSGTEVQIGGYIIPVDAVNGYYVLSAFPFAACFFCGGAGPETVIDLDLSERYHFRTDQRATFRGVLELNHSDPYQLPYRIVRARPVRPSK